VARQPNSWEDVGRSSNPGDKSDNSENADGQYGRERARHSDSHRNLQEGEVFGHAGGFMLSARRLNSSDLRGSLITFVSMKSHLGHSKVRFSERSGLGAIVVRFIMVRHLTQRGRSIGESKTSVKEEVMLLTSV